MSYKLRKMMRMKWKTAWSYLPLDFGTKIGTLKDTVQKTTFWNNISGDRVRVTFSNRYGRTAMTMKEVIIAQKKKGTDDIISSVHLTRDGKRHIHVMPGESCHSDEAIFNVNAGDDIVLWVHFEDELDVYKACCTWSRMSWKTTYIQNTGKENTILSSPVQFPFIESYMHQADVLVGISEISVLTQDEVHVITLFGDSITHMSYYSDALMEKLYNTFKGRVTLLNKGLGGNKLLSDATVLEAIPGHGRASGPSGLSRFEADVFGSEQPDDVYILIGINDLMHPYLKNDLRALPELEDLIGAYKKLIAMGHSKGSRVYLSTLLPLKHTQTPFGPEGEQLRQSVNAWILSQDLADGVFDLCKAVSKDEQTMIDAYHIGDGLHPNSEGGIAMAKEVLKTGGMNSGTLTS